MAKNRRSSLAGSKWSALRITLHADFRIVSPQRARVFILYFFMIQLAALRWILCTNTLTRTHTRKRVCVLPATRTGRILNLINLKRLRRRCILLLGLALPPCCCCCCCFCFRWRCDAIRLAQRKIWKKNKKKIKSNSKSQMRNQNPAARGRVTLSSTISTRRMRNVAGTCCTTLLRPPAWPPPRCSQCWRRAHGGG